jgi:hypothetical protein
MTITLEDVTVTTDDNTPDGSSDAIPPVFDVEYPCEVCGREAGPYAGRGRKPKRCPEHKRGSSSSSAPKTKGNNAVLAGQAADNLAQLNNILAFGSMAVGMNATASAIASANDGFRSAAYEALVTDPALCRSILRAGKSGGKVALAMAYMMFGVNVIPVAKMELDEKRAQRVTEEE